MDYKKIYQLFILGTGNLDYGLKNGLGGVILFSKDIISEDETIYLIRKINEKSVIKPFISIDQEGGRVERTENIYPKHLSAKYAFEKGEDFLREQTFDMAKQLLNLGFNLNFSPCVDVNTNENNPIIGERAFADNAEDVIRGGKIVSDVYSDYKIIPCIKHFPGHGDTDVDSHKDLPVIKLSKEDLEEYHIKAFKELIKSGIDMVMVGHLYCECFDEKETPATLSKNVINYIKSNLGYDGVLISDDMMMKGIKLPLDEAFIKGIDAGLDMFIYRVSDDTSYEAIETVIKYAEKHSDFREKTEKSYEKIIQLKKKYSIL